MIPWPLVVALVFAFSATACSSGVAAPPASTAAPTFLQAVPLAGIPDRGDDPAVVAIVAGGPALCSGTLVAPDAVLTSRRCVSVTSLVSSCPDGGPEVVAALAPDSLHVLAGDTATAAQERARGRQIFVDDDAATCGDDVAILLLDTPIDDIQPLAVRPTGAAEGDALRTVDYAVVAGASAPMKLVRDDVLVTDVSSRVRRNGLAQVIEIPGLVLCHILGKRYDRIMAARYGLPEIPSRTGPTLVNQPVAAQVENPTRTSRADPCNTHPKSTVPQDVIMEKLFVVIEAGQNREAITITPS
jgi:hypothetical protein